MIHREKNVTLESHTTLDNLQQTLFGVVVDRSSIGIELVLRGIPVYHFFDDCQISPFRDIALTSLSQLKLSRELPSNKSRIEFLERIARQTWTNEEITNGEMLDKLHQWFKTQK